MRGKSMLGMPVRIHVTHRVVTVLTAIAMVGPSTSEIHAQEPPDSAIRMDPLVVTVLRPHPGLGRAAARALVSPAP